MGIASIFPRGDAIIFIVDHIILLILQYMVLFDIIGFYSLTPWLICIRFIGKNNKYVIELVLVVVGDGSRFGSVGTNCSATSPAPNPGYLMRTSSNRAHNCEGDVHERS